MQRLELEYSSRCCERGFATPLSTKPLTSRNELISAFPVNQEPSLQQAQKDAMTSVDISIGMLKITDGVLFYSNAFGFLKVAEPVPGVAATKLGAATVCLLEKKAPRRGSRPQG